MLSAKSNCIDVALYKNKLLLLLLNEHMYQDSKYICVQVTSIVDKQGHQISELERVAHIHVFINQNDH